MKVSSLWLLGATAFTGASAAAGAAKPKGDDADGNTYFNGVKVPPMMEISSDSWEKDIHASKYVIIDHYSPYCPHCRDYAPTYQTLYEYYYTSHPATDPSASFTDFYDVRFATVNCIAYYDLCSKLEITSYPSTVLYKNGEVAATVRGGKGLDTLTETFEPYLEEEKPGTRPKELSLPQTGDKQTPDYNPAAEIKPDENVGKEEEEAQKVSEASDGAPEGKLSKLSEAFNPDGVSVPLNADEFYSSVVTDQKPWFIKFYAPWCHHCQAMGPSWQQLAKGMQDKLNIGEVNCDVESKLCKEVGARGFPTLLFFKGNERVEYKGLRGLGDFTQFAEKAIDAASGVVDVDAASLEAVEEKEDVIFIYFYDDATTSEDFMALERLPLSVVGHAKVVKTKDPALYERYKITTFPRLVVSREGRPTYYNPLTPREMRDVNGILAWMKSVWLPIVPELIASNAREIMEGKIVVLGILNREDQDAFAAAKHELKASANEWIDKQILAFQQERQELRDAKQLRIEEAEDRGDERAAWQAKTTRIDMNMSNRKEVAFAWVDGVFWQRWIKTTYGIDVKDGDRVIINDEDRHRYWDTTITGNNILLSRTSILETVGKVVASPPQISAKSTLSRFEKFFFDVRMFFLEHPIYSSAFFLALVVSGAVYWRNRIRGSRGGQYARMDDSWSTKELMKEGLLGGGVNGNGKVD